MFVSVFLGPFSRSAADDRPLIDLCLEQAEEAAGAGFCMVTFGEQHFNNYEPYCNPFLMAARLSPNLGDAYFGTTIVPLVFHHPLRLAEDSNVIDLLTEGKFIMGMSAGRVGFSPDFQNFATDPDRRQEIYESKLDILIRARRQQPEDSPLILDTPWDKGAMIGRLMPLSYRRDGALLAVGTNTDATIEWAGEQGLPVFLGPCLLSDAALKLRRHREAQARAGFSEVSITENAMRSLVTRHVIVGRTEEEAWERAELLAGQNFMMDRSNDSRTLRELAQVDLADTAAREDPNLRNVLYAQSWVLAGDPSNVARQIKEYEQNDIVQLNTRFTVGAYNPTEFRASFRLFIDEVLPQIDAQTFPPIREEEIREEHRVPLASA